MKSRVFLLSPANCRGRRAQQVLSPVASFPVAAKLRSETGVPIGELFAHISGLYFRGKLAYARRFGRGFVITPDRGLIPIETGIRADELIRFAGAEIDLANPSYREPLRTTAEKLSKTVGKDAEFVLLGSVASEKYVQILGSVFGRQLMFPTAFVGRGDMIERLVTDFPEPDSPTTPSVSPGRSSKLTPSTARTVRPSSRKYVRSSRTEMRGLVVIRKV